MFGAKGHFDDSVLSAFIRSVGIYPVGSLVRLKSGILAVVVKQNETRMTAPRVRLFYSIAQSRLLPATDVETEVRASAVRPLFTNTPVMPAAVPGR